jgi:hypothetical protein
MKELVDHAQLVLMQMMIQELVTHVTTLVLNVLDQLFIVVHYVISPMDSISKMMDNV